MTGTGGLDWRTRTGTGGLGLEDWDWIGTGLDWDGRNGLEDWDWRTGTG